MALLERVATLLRANVNEMLDKAENPPVMLKQLLRDMENQLLQVKTQVAVAVADEHVLRGKCAECEDAVASWRRRAELALAKGDEALARAAVQRCLQAERTLEGYAQQLADQRTEAEWMRDRYRLLEAKLAETTSEGELLLAAHRRVTRRNGPDATTAQAHQVLKRMRDTVLTAQAAQTAKRETEAALPANLDDELEQLEKRERVDALLAELKRKPHLLSN